MVQRVQDSRTSHSPTSRTLQLISALLLAVWLFIPVDAVRAQIPEPTASILFFRSNAEGAKGNLFLMEADGANVRQIGHSGTRPDHYPNWSHDGMKITFESYRRGGWRIWIMDQDGGNARRLIGDGFGTESYEFDPAFNALGDKVVYSRGGDLYQVSVGSGATRQLTRTADIAEFQPDVSTNGELVFVMKTGAGSEIAMMDLRTGRRVQLTKSAARELSPVWSPDGKRILFYSDQDGGFEMFLMDADGGRVKRVLTDGAFKEYGIRRGRYLNLDEGWNTCLQYRASFSPDGQWISFSADTSGSREIFLTSIDAKRVRQLTKNRLHDGFPVFNKR